MQKFLLVSECRRRFLHIRQIQIGRDTFRHTYALSSAEAPAGYPPARSLFLSPQPPHNTKRPPRRREHTYVWQNINNTWDGKIIRYLYIAQILCCELKNLDRLSSFSDKKLRYFKNIKRKLGLLFYCSYLVPKKSPHPTPFNPNTISIPTFYTAFLYIFYVADKKNLLNNEELLYSI